MSNTRTLTAADVSISLTCPPSYPAAVVIQGFATDNVFAIGDVSTVQTAMGVDGRLSAGYSCVPTTFTIYLQGDSQSVDVFENIIQAQRGNLRAYALNMYVDAPGLQKSATFTRGFITGGAPFNSAARMMGSRTFNMTFEKMTVVPLLTG